MRIMSLNRQAALHNIRYLCPSLATILINCYRQSAELYVDGQVLYSEEGTTQGDVLAMPMYSLATIPLINDLGTFENVKQVWYADDASASGSILHLRSWWNHLLEIGPGYSYFVNSNKSWLVVKSDSLSFAKDLFRDTDVNVTADGHPHLGVPLGTRSYVEQFISEKVTPF